ncbi:MAG: hypothetical protein ACXVCO_01750, partial [Ktedonobacterales bacterium]
IHVRLLYVNVRWYSPRFEQASSRLSAQEYHYLAERRAVRYTGSDVAARPPHPGHCASHICGKMLPVMVRVER